MRKKKDIAPVVVKSIKWSKLELNSVYVMSALNKISKDKGKKILFDVDDIRIRLDKWFKKKRTFESVKHKLTGFTMSGNTIRYIIDEIISSTEDAARVPDKIALRLEIPEELANECLYWVSTTFEDPTYLKFIIKNSCPLITVANSRKFPTKCYEPLDTYRFAVLSDTHIGSKYFEYDKLCQFYEIAHNMGVRDFLHAGDLMDGYKVYEDQKYDQCQKGFTEQVNEVIAKYPMYDDSKTYVIMGNHDKSLMKESTNPQRINPFKEIQKIRKDFVYLGESYASLNLHDYTFFLYHPNEKLYKNLIGSLQNKIDQENKKYDFFFVGHTHQWGSFTSYKSKFASLVGSFLSQNSWARSKRFNSVVGGIVVTVNKYETYESIIPEYIENFTL